MSTGATQCPLDLAEITKKQDMAIDQAMQTEGTTTLLRQCVKCQFEFPTNRTTRRFSRDPLIVNKLLGEIPGKSLGETGAFRRFHEIRAQLGLPPDFDHITPAAKVKMLEKAKGGSGMVAHFLSLGAEINLLMVAKSSLPAVRSGVNSYLKFPPPSRATLVPPTEDTVQLWSATFSPWKTFN